MRDFGNAGARQRSKGSTAAGHSRAGGPPEVSAPQPRSSPCNVERFTERVMADEGMEHAYCRCCGKRIAYQGDQSDGTPDGYCRWCYLGHPERIKVERPKLLEVPDGR